jgi:hypothetical protein
MKRFIFALVLLGTLATIARSQDAIPDLKGTWSGKGKAIVFGNNLHHPGSQTVTDPPRVHEIEATYVVQGQDGRVAWGRSSSTVANTQEPFAWAISGDGKTILWRRYGRIFQYHAYRARPYGEVLYPKRDKPERVDRRRVL